MSTPLPTLADTVTIDGTSQPGWVSTPLITVDGAGVGFQGNGLTVTADGCKIKGLVVQDFHNNAGIALYSNNNILTGDSLTNNAYGVEIANGVSGNVIGGTTVRGRNVITRNTYYGVVIEENSTNNVVQGNYIGTDGYSALGNGTGVEIQGGANNNLIGGTAVGAGNLISGNTSEGIYIDPSVSGTQVQGNNIGINGYNGGALANGNYGVLIQGSNTTVGGTAAGAGNLISGNTGFGIRIDSSGNQVLGNNIGTSSIGTYVFAVANSSGGVLINGGSNNTVGGTAAGAGNLISGNTGPGIMIETSLSGNLVQGNKIGTNAAGTAALANGGYGVDIYGSNNTVGGTAAGAGNLISGNTGGGIVMESSASGNHVQGNKIGTNAAGTAAVPNAGAGVVIYSSNNTVGGTVAGAGNIIAFNQSYGVLVASGTGDAIHRNSIFGNRILGIDLNGGSGNNNRAAPTLTKATFNATTHVMTITGTLTSTASTSFTLEFFANPVGQSQGQIYLGSFVVTTNAAGTVTFIATITIPTTTPFSSVTTPIITATATDPTGDTSQFSIGVHDPVAPIHKVRLRGSLR